MICNCYRIKAAMRRQNHLRSIPAEKQMAQRDGRHHPLLGHLFITTPPAQYDELRMRQHGSLPKLYADDLRQYTSLNMATRVPKEDFPPCDKR